MMLCTAGECVVPGELPLNSSLLVIQGVEWPQISMYATNLIQWLGTMPSWRGEHWVLHHLPLLHDFFFGFVSQCGSLHRSAFVIVCGLAPKPFCVCSFTADKAGLLGNASDGPLALAGASSLVPLMPQDRQEPPWLWLAQQPRQQGPGSDVADFFLLSSALALLPAKSLRMWISQACIHLLGRLSSAARLKWRHRAWSEATARSRSSAGLIWTLLSGSQAW